VVEARTAPEIRSQALFRDRLVGAVRSHHPLASSGVTLSEYLSAQHVIVSRSGQDADAVERPFLPDGLTRRVASAVSGFANALALARRSDLIATVPERHTTLLREEMFSFPLPVPTMEFTVSMLWHPRMDADAGHRWFRSCVREVCLLS